MQRRARAESCVWRAVLCRWSCAWRSGSRWQHSRSCYKPQTVQKFQGEARVCQEHRGREPSNRNRGRAAGTWSRHGKVDVCLLREGRRAPGLGRSRWGSAGATATGWRAGDPAASAGAAQEASLMCCLPSGPGGARLDYYVNAWACCPLPLPAGLPVVTSCFALTAE